MIETKSRLPSAFLFFVQVVFCDKDLKIAFDWLEYRFKKGKENRLKNSDNFKYLGNRFPFNK